MFSESFQPINENPSIEIFFFNKTFSSCYTRIGGGLGNAEHFCVLNCYVVSTFFYPKQSIIHSINNFILVFGLIFERNWTNVVKEKNLFEELLGRSKICPLPLPLVTQLTLLMIQQFHILRSVHTRSILVKYQLLEVEEMKTNNPRDIQGYPATQSR